MTAETLHKQIYHIRPYFTRARAWVHVCVCARLGTGEICGATEDSVSAVFNAAPAARPPAGAASREGSEFLSHQSK